MEKIREMKLCKVEEEIINTRSDGWIGAYISLDIF